MRKKRFEPEGSEKYKEVKNNIKRCMKKAKENWIGEQCSKIEENLRTNSKRAYQLVEDLTTVKQDLCDKRRELRKKRFEAEGAEKYKEVKNNIKRCTKKAKEN